MSHLENNLNLNNMWSKVSEGVDHIYQFQEMPVKAYMEFYT